MIGCQRPALVVPTEGRKGVERSSRPGQFFLPAAAVTYEGHKRLIDQISDEHLRCGSSRRAFIWSCNRALQ
jgi:hypothetical protein